MLAVHFSTSFLLLTLCASVQHILAAPTTKPLPVCFTSEIDLSVKWPVTLTTTGSLPVQACNGTVLGQVDDAGLLALKTARVGTLPNHLDVFMPNSTCFLPLSDVADERQAEAIGNPYTALSTRAVPCGTTLYIPALDGFVLPKGAGVHDGCVRAVNRQAEIKSKCAGVLNIGSEDNSALFAKLVGQTAIQPKTCVPGAYKTFSLVTTPSAAEDEEEDSEEFDYDDPSASDTAQAQDPTSSRLVLISTGSDSKSEDASYSLEEDASYSLDSDPVAGDVDSSSSTTAPTTGSDSEEVEWVDCDDNGNPIVSPSGSSSAPVTQPSTGGSTSSSSNIVYVYVECDANGNPIENASSGSEDDIEYVDCDQDGNPILDNGSHTSSGSHNDSQSGSDDIEYVDCDKDGNPIIPSGSASGSDSGSDIEYVDCDENGNPI